MLVISIGRQMAFYLGVSEDQLNFTSCDDDSCTVEVNGEAFDVFFNPIDLIVWEYLPAV